MYVSTVESFDMLGEISFTWNKSNYLDNHSHTYWECFIVLDGSAYHTINDKQYILEKNTLWIIRPNEVHSLKKYKNLKFSRLNILSTIEETQRLCSILGNNVYDYLANYQFPLSISLEDFEVKEFSSNITKYMTLTASHGYGQELLKMLILRVIIKAYDVFIANDSKYPKWLNDFITLLSQEENLKNKINDIIAKSNYSYSHMSKLFKQYTGKTLLEYFKTIKLNYACELLKKTNYKCAYIAEKIGYNSISHFTYAFKQEYGINPQDYRTQK